ncbi:Zn-dependent peptidase ImmA, M78 family [Parafrankia irregularis]|uniref:Zn-dependent peptidase ImmA, M78 family n=1 Tax=Parafrankia irregularis TaxID=795642 RepID=A0A0S4QKF1_9ACTN|nr:MULTISPECIES: XRE family transcriptional regulator [Parafrankia]MBE3204142.1 ImmA/IrrE family metallo-endopeptidase [Parafrankia sp. CH37]CUU54982.1 Zn-dependent peptidase ImmA, M78 family [Parafrankia irregularis]
MDDPQQLCLPDLHSPRPAIGTSALAAIAVGFDPARLTQARRLAGLTKRAVADQLLVSPVAVGQWEAGTHAPRPDHVAKLSDLLGVPPAFLAAGRPYARLESSAAHFRSLRRTPVGERQKAIAFTEQLWELTYALEKRVQLPPIDLPGFSAGEVVTDATSADPVTAARALRQAWNLGTGPIPHLVRSMEHHGLIVTLVPFAGMATATVDAFSTSHLPRPVVVLTPDRADDVYRHRFTAAHELGHLLLHPDTAPGDAVQEKEADAFAAEFLTPSSEITSLLPGRVDLHALDRLSRQWGVSVGSLIYRCREVGAVSDAAYRRAYQRLSQLRNLGLFQHEAVDGYPGEIPVLLSRAFALAEEHGLTLAALAAELAWPLPRLRLLLGQPDAGSRPRLRLV